MTPGDPVRELVLDSLLEQVPLVVFAYDRAGLCTYCDGAGLSAVALRPAELVGANLLELSDHLPGQADHLRGALDGKSASYTWRRGEASFDTWLTPLTDASGEVVGAIGITLDVSEKARDKDDLDLHRAFVDASPQFVALARIDGKVTYVNPGGRRMAGIPTDVDVTTTTIPDYLTEEGLQLSLEVEQPEVIAKGYYDGETTLKHWPSGRGIPVRVSSFLVRDALTGEPRALATVQTDITAEKVARLEADRRISQQRALLLHLHEAQEVERRRIAGEMHDDTIQAVAAVNIRLQSLRRTLSAAGLVAESESVAQMSESVRDATERLRGLLYTIDSPDVLERDLVTALRDYVRETGSPEGPAVDVVTLLVDTLPAHVSRVLFRIAQEAVGNARAHAAARTVTVTAGQRDGGFILSVRDDGVGLPEHLATSARGRAPAAAGHIGLRTMAERAESVGGWCSVRGLAEGGTLVEVWLPARIGYTSAASGETVPGGLSHALLQQTMESISEGFAALD
ncbi:MAG: PAS domain-containing sensor histidine kinase, partial [Actinomycetes bacterium]